MNAPTLPDLRTTEATLRALAEAEPHGPAEDARASMLALVALEIGQRVRVAEMELVQRERGRQWAALMRKNLGKGE